MLNPRPFFLLAAALVAACGETTDDLSGTAPFMCQEFVKRRLQAPATAEFPNPYRDGTMTVPLDSLTFRVTSYVDAENAFSAKLRQRYSCTVRKAEGDNWDLVALTFADQ